MSEQQTGKKGRKQSRNIKYRLSMRIITVLVIALCGLLSYKTYQVNQEIDQYTSVRDDLKEQVKNEKSNQEDIKEQISYMNSDEYIEEQAREKLGLVFDDEIIFKKQNR